MKLLYGVIGLAFAPLLFAGNDAAYPTEKVAAFVFEKVDVTTLPSAIRRKARQKFRSKYWKRRNLEFSYVLTGKPLVERRTVPTGVVTKAEKWISER